MALRCDDAASGVTANMIEEWLTGLSVGPRARNNIRMSIVTLFQYARAHGYLPNDQRTEAEHVARAKCYALSLRISPAAYVVGDVRSELLRARAACAWVALRARVARRYRKASPPSSSPIHSRPPTEGDILTIQTFPRNLTSQFYALPQ